MSKLIRLSDHFTYGKLLRFTLPSICMMVFTSIYGVVDGLFVSNFVGKTPFAAVNLVMPFVMILGGMGFMIGTGGTALVSKLLGEGKQEEAHRTFSMLVLFTLLLGAVLSAVGILTMPAVSRLLGGGQVMMYGELIENQFLFTRNWHFGAALSLVMMVLVLISMWLFKRNDGSSAEGGMLL